MSAKGLQWNRRFAKVKVPSVYSKDKWAERRLTDVELADVLDLPGTLRKRLKPSQLAKAREMSVPGKVVVALFESLYALVAGNVCGGREVSKSKVHEQQGLKRKSEGGDMQGPLGSKRSRGVDEDRKSEMVLVESTTLDRCTESAPIGSNRKGNEPFLTVSDKATKSDDAPAPIHLFDNRVLDALHVEEEQRLKATEALDVLRRFGLRLWKRKVRRSFANWLRKWDSGAKTGCNAMVQAGWNACRRADGASCWDWDAGSALLFWRWPEDYQRESWEGVAPYFIGELPSSKSPQPPYEVEEVRRKVSAKLQKVLDRRYIEVVRDSELKSYMFMFDVPKGDSDVRMVYDGSKSGFNDATWAPWFTLPTVEAMTRTVLPWGWCGDRDFGEMFLNFPLHPMARLYSGVDLSQLTLNKVKRVEEDHFVGQWTRNAMGLKSSPYLAVQAATRVKRKFLGDQHDSNNPFRWSSCILNLPGSAGYDPTMPWIQKGREDGSIATDLHIYVDDVRITGSSQESVWCAGSRVAKLCSFYGLQDAPRKLREPSQDPGAWAGSVVSTSHGVVTKFVTKERWRKTQGCIRWLANKIGIQGDQWSGGIPEDEYSKVPPAGTLPHKQAERIRGFLIYVSRTYKAMVPYLKGLHLTLDFWRANRDEEGWREGYNLILRLEELLKSGKVRCGTELWVFTDNAVSESAFNKGSSKSKLLHELCSRVRKAEMAYSLQVQVVWIAGTRMISQGTDGLSQGDLTSGVMAGDEFLSHIPLNQGAFDRSPDLKEWLETALPKQWVWLRTGEDWYRLPFDDPLGRYVWAPPPCLADVALEQLCEAKLIHPFTSHVFVCPVLFTGHWRKQFAKAVDVEFGIPVGSPVWNESCHENLVVGLMCPLLRCSPWAIKRSDRADLDKFRHTMLGMLRDGDSAARSHMCKFWNSAWSKAELGVRGSVAW
ncbi:hypothetical protein MHU86_18586 [Fragilaria crotonensis]|nr:hypothetical protein MHU86_18586 [Fragilaria crotonensis]